MLVCLSDHSCDRSHVIEHFLRNAVQNSFIGMGMRLCRNLAQSCGQPMQCACGRSLKCSLITHILLGNRIKHSLVVSLPLEVRYRADDLLMIESAEQLLQGHWLGDYHSIILMKGMF